MKIQVLVASMNQEDHSLPQRMNLKCDAIIGNQCDRNSVEEFEWEGNRIKYLNFAERGVGLNRNNALMRADADICLFADDDMVYCDNYTEIVEKAFQLHPDADIIVFNLIEKKITRYVIKREEKIGYLNYLRYGTARIAVRLNRIKEEGIFFNLCFGGGTKYSHGEDTLFLTDCLRSRMKIYAVPKYIAKLTEERVSTWNTGYDKKYLKDQGRLFRAITKRWWKLLCLQDAVRRRKSYRMKWWKAYSIMISHDKR